MAGDWKTSALPMGAYWVGTGYTTSCSTEDSVTRVVQVHYYKYFPEKTKGKATTER